MRLAVSNIAWGAADDDKVYTLLKQNGYEGVEIAPTRVFPNCPYDDLKAASGWMQWMKKAYGLCVPSMQSIWYGRQERLFGAEEERRQLIDYTMKAIDFAESIGCRNLVFGCPRNRVLPEGMTDEAAVTFFHAMGDYAVQHHTVIGMEANPPIYNTNYINDTAAALDMIHRVNSPGFRLNLDVGTMIFDDEDVELLAGHVSLINHVHISEPGLKPIQERALHSRLARVLRNEKYQHFVSIEMGLMHDLNNLGDILAYVRDVFA